MNYLLLTQFFDTTVEAVENAYFGSALTQVKKGFPQLKHMKKCIDLFAKYFEKHTTFLVNLFLYACNIS